MMAMGGFEEKCEGVEKERRMGVETGLSKFHDPCTCPRDAHPSS